MRHHILYDEDLLAVAAELRSLGELSREPLGDTVRFALELPDGTRFVGVARSAEAAFLQLVERVAAHPAPSADPTPERVIEEASDA